jgi:formiminotetrahydrofolate cyclodeaminase
MYIKKSLKKYSNDLAAKLPAPGGGSAAALNACLGVSLISMVVNFTIGKPRFIRYQKYLKATLRQSERLRKRFLDLVDLDVAAYQSRNIKRALGVPLEIARLCFEAIGLCPDLVKKGNKNLISDLAVAAAFLESSFAAARVNVDINLKYLADKKLSKTLGKELATKGRLAQKIRVKTEEKVNEIIRR